MKLWHSFIKELKLASRGFYFYIEIFMAVILLAVLLFVIPENFSSKESEYIYLDLPEVVEKVFIEDIKEEDLDGESEIVQLKSDGNIIEAKLYESDETKFYLLNDEISVVKLSETEKKLGAVISLDAQGKLHYKYYLQGYESQRLKNILLVFHNKDMDLLKDKFDKQDVKKMYDDYQILSDRENVIPSFLTFNGSLMGLFIIAAYIFLDKQEGIIKAYAVTASSVWQYLLSKVGVIIVTSIGTSLIMVLPVMGLKPNYPLLLLFLITTGFFSSSLGLLAASFYDNITQAFGVIYVLVVAMMIPNIAYFIPSWEPDWIKIIPAYPMLEGFKEIIQKNGDVSYVLMTSFGFFVVGLVLFLLANVRYKKTLTV